MKRTIIVATLALMMSGGGAFACAPAPSCWIKAGPEYLRTICHNAVRDHQSLQQMAENVEEPEKIQTFGKACKNLGINIPRQSAGAK